MGSFITKFIKFCLVGGSGVFVDFGITFVCKEWVKLNKYVANSLGFICAASSNYILNRIWTFSSTDPNIAGQYLRFIAISLVGLAINNSILWLLNDKLRVDFNSIVTRLTGKGTTTSTTDRINFYSSKLCAIVIVTVWNFLMNYFFNF